ncbi:hypothetical protein VIGAN_03104900 [Vigna angularis var. angularis]|uniref:Uncharacterized protein n=1 Tax=Vigna angularis var. angularis TaxID=157739 RepID=A0A0S3RLE7_PHAAN|nr:hypothetical protein VIGAN_03104900 [Vigna angularis var. angularis]
MRGEVLAGRERKDVFRVTGAKREWKDGENGEENEMKGDRAANRLDVRITMIIQSRDLVVRHQEGRATIDRTSVSS